MRLARITLKCVHRPLVSAAVAVRCRLTPLARCIATAPSELLRNAEGGALNNNHINLTVRVAGFVHTTRDVGGCVFLLLRDAYGILQVIVTSAQPDLFKLARNLPKESVIVVDGVVKPRAAGARNASMHTGNIELAASHLRVVTAPATAPPIPVGDVDSVADAGDESLRLRHRIHDLRRPYLVRNLRLRSAVSVAIRAYLTDEVDTFTEIETPTLFRSTPEGAREFLVPTRQSKSAYALIQSPQQWKQMLMAAGVERYFQFARCYRDESGRADRQPEFTQIDLECAWVRAFQVMAIAEGILSVAVGTANEMQSPCRGAWGQVFRSAKGYGAADGWRPPSLPVTPLPRVTYAHAMATYGVDKPDRRLGMPIGDASALAVGGTSSLVPALRPWGAGVAFTGETDAELAQFDAERASVRVFKSAGLAAELSNKDLEAVLGEVAQAVSPTTIAGLVHGRDAACMWLRVQPDGAFKSSSGVKAILTAEGITALIHACDAHPGDMLFLTAGYGTAPCVAAGVARIVAAEACRLLSQPLEPHGTHVRVLESDILPAAANLKHRLARKGGQQQQEDVPQSDDDDTLDAFWVTDFPLLEASDGALQSCHHPFTAPREEDEATLRAFLGGDASVDRTALLRVRGQHYDLVINGSELGGGSIRIHDAALQRAVLKDVLRITPAQMDGFEPLLTALEHGAPPHGGIALGFDRLIAMLAGNDNARSVRDVIAFPKSATGNDLLVGAPAAVTNEQLAEYGLQLKEPAA